MEINSDYHNLMTDRFRKADILIQEYRNMKASLDYYTLDDLAKKYNTTTRNLRELFDAFNINGGKQRTFQNRREDELLNAIVRMDNFNFLDNISI